MRNTSFKKGLIFVELIGKKQYSVISFVKILFKPLNLADKDKKCRKQGD